MVVVMVMVVTVAVVTLGRLLSRFSMTAGPRSLRRPRVACCTGPGCAQRPETKAERPRCRRLFP